MAKNSNILTKLTPEQRFCLNQMKKELDIRDNLDPDEVRRMVLSPIEKKRHGVAYFKVLIVVDEVKVVHNISKHQIYYSPKENLYERFGLYSIGCPL